jgi:hypothetical protein
METLSQRKYQEKNLTIQRAARISTTAIQQNLGVPE